MTRYGVDPFDEAVYDAAHNFVDPDTGEKGVAVLARRTGRNPATLSKKVDPFIETHLVNTQELRMILHETKSYLILQELVAEYEHGIFALPKPENGAGKGILSAVLKSVKEGGEACSAIDDALSDGIITAAEVVVCTKELDDQTNAIRVLRNRLVSMVVDPEHLPKSLSKK